MLLQRDNLSSSKSSVPKETFKCMRVGYVLHPNQSFFIYINQYAIVLDDVFAKFMTKFFLIFIIVKYFLYEVAKIYCGSLLVMLIWKACACWTREYKKWKKLNSLRSSQALKRVNNNIKCTLISTYQFVFF